MYRNYLATGASIAGAATADLTETYKCSRKDYYYDTNGTNYRESTRL